MILIISQEKDAHSQKVEAVLKKKGHAYDLLNLSSFPATAQLAISFDADKYTGTRFEKTDKILDMPNYRAIWWRRPQLFTLHDEMKGQTESSFSYTECQSAVNGMWLLEQANWINHPVKDEVASRKVYQLKVATECGLTIPKTLITNSAEKATRFVNELQLGNVIYKSFSATEQAWRETRLLKEDEIPKLDNVKYAPVIFQECIHADIDLRITIIGEQIYAAAIYSQETSYKVDFRMNYHEAKIVPHELPSHICEKLLALMKKLDLVYGAIDMRRRLNGEYVFLEINTAGQWLFMEEPTGMAITEALADKLIALDK